MKRLFPLALAALTAASASAAPVFRNPIPIPIELSSASHVLAADFDGDGHRDVLAVGSGLMVLLANGAPFSTPRITPLPTAVGEAAIGDVDRDGKNDVVVSDPLTNRLLVMHGNGDGTFRAGATPATIHFPGPMALADFNGDTLLDLAVGSQSSTSDNPVAVHFGDGAGRFSSATTSAPDHGPFSLTPADMNGDGKVDLIAASWARTRILLNNGSGTFTEKAGLVAGGVLADDFNDDGKLDVALAAGGSHNWYVEVAFGNGDGTMTHSASYAAGYEATSVVGADLDDDGNTDLIVAAGEGSTVAVLHGNADGTFDAPQFFLTGNNAWKLAVSDFDRDGREDFLSLDYTSETWSLSFVRGVAGGGFDSYRAFHTNSLIPMPWPGLGATDGTTADIDGDSDRDVVLVQLHEGTSGPYDLVVMLNDGTGKLGPPLFTGTAIDSWSDPPGIDVADVNGDGDVDVLVSASFAYEPVVRMFLGNGDGTFDLPLPVNATVYGPPKLAHFDGDANLDLFIAAGSQVALYPGNGDGTFGEERLSYANGWSVLHGDLDGDGKMDFVSSWIRSTSVYLNDGTGRFTRKDVTDEEIEVIAAGDFDGDGKLDLLFRTYGGTQTRFGNGDGTFSAPVSFLIGPVPGSAHPGPVVTADFDGDGKLDFAVGTSVYLGSGDGTFHSRSRFRTIWASASSVADMDRNGSPDLVITKHIADDVDVLLTREREVATKPIALGLAVDKSALDYGETLTFTASVTGATLVPSGVVLFEVDGKRHALVAVNSRGKATLTIRPPVGAHEVRAIYSGDEYHAVATSSAQRYVVSKGATTLQVSGTPNPQASGRIVRIYAGLSVPGGYDVPPTGSITLREGNVVLGQVQPNQTLSIGTLGVGTHTITATYAGDANFESSTASYEQVITKPLPPLLLSTTPSAEALFAGEPVAIRASFPNATNVTGTVTFYAGDQLLATVTVAEGAAQHQTSLAAGLHTISIQYSGDSTWAPASRTLEVNVNAARWDVKPQLTATGAADGSVTFSWTPLAGAASYTLWFKESITAPWRIFSSTPAPAAGTTSRISASMVLLFTLTATDGAGKVSSPSAPDLVAAVGYADPALGKGTQIRARDFIELRPTIARLRNIAGLAAYPYTTTPAAGQPIRVADLAELRTALSQARAAIGLPPVSFTDPTPTARTTRVRAVHVLELRAGLD